jgi:hypothetical protein
MEDRRLGSDSPERGHRFFEDGGGRRKSDKPYLLGRLLNRRRLSEADRLTRASSRPAISAAGRSPSPVVSQRTN